MMKNTLLMLMIVVGASAKIRWPFEWSQEHRTFLLNSTIGTPGQSVPLSLSISSKQVEVPGISNRGGVFDQTSSSTFVKTGDVYDENGNFLGVNGTDKFMIGNSAVELNKPFMVQQESEAEYDFYGILGESFIKKVLDGESEKVLVATWDVDQSKARPSYTGGVITLGGNPSDCSSQWTTQSIVEKTEFDEDLIAVKSLKIGKYSFQKSMKMGFSLNTDLMVPNSIIENIMRALGSIDGMTIDCNTSTQLVFELDDNVKLNLEPKVYIEKKQGSNLCAFKLDSFGHDYFQLPIGLMNKCYLKDYGNSKIGFSNSLN